MRRLLLFLFYTALIFAGVFFSMPLLALAALLLICARLLRPALVAGRAWAWGGLALIVALGLLVAMQGDGRYVLQMISLVVFLLLMILFGRTLRPGDVPLATRVAAAARGYTPEQAVTQMAPALRRYTRVLTWFWAVMFGLFVLQSLVLVFYAPSASVGLTIDLVNFGIVFVLMGGEYLYHSHKYPNP
ncbi:MAG: hypothetical protein ACREO9_03565, partial [Lysobacterales bacterium]